MTTVESAPSSRRKSPVRRFVRTAGVVGTVATLILAVYAFLAIFGPWIVPHDPLQINVGPTMSMPSAEFPLGTDALGRDELSRVIAAVRPALLACVIATGLALLVGTVLGLAAGFWGGIVDNVVARLVDFVFAIPEYLLAILVLAIMGPSLLNASIAISIVYMPRFARTVRGATEEVMARSYISAARLSGRSSGWIITRHVLPNVASPLVVLAAINLSMASGTYASLSFLGFAVRPPNPDFGSMIGDALQYIDGNPWLLVPPAATFVILILAIIIFGDVVRGALDPKARVR
jgi:ABC-type dipeptide/oligopeptide/nickel transport system permease subunit